MRFLRDAILTILALIVIAGALAYFNVASGGLSAAEQPGRVEKAVAGRLLRLSVPPESKKIVNPYAADTSAWRTASDHYADHCATCHGNDGHGATEIGRNMYPKVPDLAAPQIQDFTDGELFYIIQNGVRWTGMPGWKSEHTDEETWKLVSFVRHVPQLTAHDIEKNQSAHDGAQPHH